MRCSLKLKSFSAAVISAAVISGFAASVFACGPDFPNNLLDGGDNAVLQAPHADFQHELELMEPAKTSVRVVPPASGQTFRDQATDAEMSDLEAALKHSGLSTARVTAILTEHLHQRAKLKAYQEKYLMWRDGFNRWKREYPWQNSRWVALPLADPKEINELLYDAYVQTLPGFVHFVGNEQQGFKCFNGSYSLSESLELIPGIPDVDIGWKDWDDWNDLFIKPDPGVTIMGKLNRKTIEGWLRTNPPPVIADVLVTSGLPAEFSYYFRGVIAEGSGDRYQAEKLWECLLALPEKERHYKSTWAAFMLGKWNEAVADDLVEEYAETAQKDNYSSGQYRQAAEYYEQVRELARKGFADPTGLAASSLGLEARVRLKQKGYGHAIELYLEQFAAGDGSTVNSLRFTAIAAFGEQGASPEQFAALAKNPRVRRVLTAYLISTRLPGMFANYEEDRTDRQVEQRTASVWLDAVESAGIKEVEYASQFALAAYQAGRMDLAQRWVRRAGDEPVAQWLQAKLLLRDGKIDEAAKLLAQLSHQFPQTPPVISLAKTFAASLTTEASNDDDVEHSYLSTGQQALGELGVLHLARREYTEALDALLRSSYWMDAAYVAERVMTTDEFKDYVDRNWPAVSGSRKEPPYEDGYHYGENKPTMRQDIRYLLARRLARDGRYTEAGNYYPKEWTQNFDALVAALKTGRDVDVPPAKRAEALMIAAFITRTNGMELLGTELAPDWFIEAGDFEYGVTWEKRAKTRTNAKINVASLDEIERGQTHHADPEERWHYRDLAQQLKIEATCLFWDAAQLTPDNSDETARLLIRGGRILERYDLKGADKFYKALAKRCDKIAIGRQANKIRWFPELDENGNLKNIIPDLDQAVTAAELEKMFETNGSGTVFCHFPVPGKNYCIHYGDTLFRIARAASTFGDPVTVQQLMDANPEVKPLKLHVEQLIWIPSTMKKWEPAKIPATNYTGMNLIPPDQGSTNSIAGSGDSPPKIAPPVQIQTDGWYVVRSGDTLALICREINLMGHHVTFRQLWKANPGLDLKGLKVGQALVIPASSAP